MTYSISITEDDVCTALRAWLIQVCGCEVVQGLGNRVPMPKGDFICITPGTQKRLGTNTVTTHPNIAQPSQDTMQPIMQGIQIDLYGAKSSDWAAIISTLWRDETTCTFMTELQGGAIQPLYNSDPIQMPLVDGEQQYEERWIVKAFLQYNGTVTLDQQFFTGANVGLVDVDANYH
jgi:hypothetical protein